MSVLSISLLGTFYVECNAKPVYGFATDKARALLAFLAVERECPHRRESLATLLWPEQTDERARQNLRQALSHLKQALGGDDFLIVTSQDVQLHPHSAVWTDVGAVEALHDACQHHLHHSPGRCLPCLQRLEQLASYYTGDFLAGFPSQKSSPFEEWVMLTRERLHQQALDAHIALAGFYERRGDLTTALKHTREQIRLEPWREEAHRAAMRLLAYQGERSNALAQYLACQRVLEKELAALPTAETTALYEAIRNEDLPSLTPVPLPAEVNTSFVGRAPEQRELAELLANPACQLITILGLGGVGKSRLALQVARAHAGLYDDGIFFVSLVAVTDIQSAIATDLGFASPEAASHLPGLLRNKHLLLVLDNFEHLIDDSEKLGELLSAAPGLQVIVTSRERLRLREEWVYPLDGLSFSTEVDDERAAQSCDSFSLFEQRAAQINPHFQFGPDQLVHLSAICRLVEGHPLAIELAASATAERSCEEIAGSLRQTIDSLVPSLRNLPARHFSLRAVVEQSWLLLSDEDRIRLAELSVFVGGFTLDAAQFVTDSTSAQLAGLTAKSLLRHQANGRYAMHESVRQFASEKLGQRARVESRHAQYFAQLAANSDFATAPMLDTLQKEQANLRVAWRWSLVANVEWMASLLKGLAMLYTLRGPVSEGEDLFSEAIQRLGGAEASPGLKDSIMIELARLYTMQMRLDASIDLVRTIPGTSPLRARALLTWGQALTVQGECETARPLLEQSLELARQLNDRRTEADSLRELGNAANRLVDYEAAAQFYAQSLALSRELGDKRGESASLNNRATVEWELGRLDDAQAHYENALALYRELGNRSGEAKALNNLSNVLADTGDLSAAARYGEQALRIHQQMGNPRGQGAVLNNLGATYFSLGRYDTASNYYQQALSIFQESNNRQAEGETQANLSLLNCTQGRYASARTCAQKAIELAGQMGDKVNLANAYYYLGRIELADGNISQAEAALQHALAIRTDVPHPGRVVEIHAELALAALKNSNRKLALERIFPVLELLSSPAKLDGADAPFRIYALTLQVLTANEDDRVEIVRTTGLSLLRQQAALINDPILRQSFEEAHTFS